MSLVRLYFHVASDSAWHLMESGTRSSHRSIDLRYYKQRSTGTKSIFQTLLRLRQEELLEQWAIGQPFTWRQ
jgi:hypothetical protein